LGSKSKEANGSPVNMITPCVKICVIHTVEKICIGCFRSRDEISQWKNYSEEERQKIMETLKNREKMIYRRRGGKRKEPTLITKDQND
jgi:uncharacterized protein